MRQSNSRSPSPNRLQCVPCLYCKEAGVHFEGRTDNLERHYEMKHPNQPYHWKAANAFKLWQHYGFAPRYRDKTYQAFTAETQAEILRLIEDEQLHYCPACMRKSLVIVYDKLKHMTRHKKTCKNVFAPKQLTGMNQADVEMAEEETGAEPRKEMLIEREVLDDVHPGLDQDDIQVIAYAMRDDVEDLEVLEMDLGAEYESTQATEADITGPFYDDI